jgi:nitroreductase
MHPNRPPVPPAALLDFLQSLRAVRRYASAPVPEPVIQHLLEVARWTGSAKNTQPWDLILVRDRATLQELATLGQFAGHLAGAAFAVVLVLGSPPNRFDAGRLAERLMLAAWAEGIGSCIGSIGPASQAERARALLGVPPDREIHTTIAFGYPADATATRVSSTPSIAAVLPLTGRRPLAEQVHRERWGQRGDLL